MGGSWNPLGVSSLKTWCLGSVGAHVARAPTCGLSLWLGLPCSLVTGFVEGASPEGDLKNEHSVRARWKLRGLLLPDLRSHRVSLSPYSLGESSHKAAHIQRGGNISSPYLDGGTIREFEAIF